VQNQALKRLQQAKEESDNAKEESDKAIEDAGMFDCACVHVLRKQPETKSLEPTLGLETPRFRT
jgi:hypothetical protein